MAGIPPKDTRSGRTYTWGEDTFVSVTTILNVLNKPALPNWAAKMSAEYVCQNIELLKSLCDADRKVEAISLIKGAPWRSRDKAANLGTAVHHAVEAYNEGRPATHAADVAPFMARFEEFLQQFSPKVVESEVTVFNRKYNYAGTLDLILEVRGHTCLVDIKSGSGVYPEHGLQVVAYMNGEFIGRRDGTEAPLPTVDRGAILHLRPNGFHFVPVRTDRSVFEAFLYCREMFRFQEELAPIVLRPEVR